MGIEHNLMSYSVVQALIWSKMSTGLPIEISSAMKGQNYISFCRLDIDIHRYDKYEKNNDNLMYIDICVVFVCVNFSFTRF